MLKTSIFPILLCVALSILVHDACAFKMILPETRMHTRRARLFDADHRFRLLPMEMSSMDTPERGDKVREKNGIRPSLHPTTINTLAEALKIRAINDPSRPMRVDEKTQPLEVAMTASAIASAAVVKRQESSAGDGMKLTVEEEQVIVGRVVGVVMRFDELESTLARRVSSTSWVAKYGEWDQFGVLKHEHETVSSATLDERIKNDPLFALSRAECLLALFIHSIEIPQMQMAGADAPDQSRIDFVDSDRLEVLVDFL